MESGVEFVAVDFPQANHLTVQGSRAYFIVHVFIGRNPTLAPPTASIQ
jgi:hypothetical protein